MINNLNDENWLYFLVANYKTPTLVKSEVDEDVKRIKYIKRLLRKYKHTGVLKERLILNHIIILSNVFGVEATTRILFLKVDREDYDVLKTFLLFLNYLPEVVRGIYGNNIHVSDIPIDLTVVKALQKI